MRYYISDGRTFRRIDGVGSGYVDQCFAIGETLQRFLTLVRIQLARGRPNRTPRALAGFLPSSVRALNQVPLERGEAGGSKCWAAGGRRTRPPSPRRLPAAFDRCQPGRRVRGRPEGSTWSAQLAGLGLGSRRCCRDRMNEPLLVRREVHIPAPPATVAH
jgi:hypothetical protein